MRDFSSLAKSYSKYRRIERYESILRIKDLQIFFSTFPDGFPGLGLLLLRTTLGTASILQGFFYLFENDSPPIGTRFLEIAAIFCGAFLIAGFLTPVFAFLVGLGGISFVVLPALAINVNLSADIYFVVVSAAIVMLGPGAFSLDAKIFGRREIIIPEKTKPLKS